MEVFVTTGWTVFIFFFSWFSTISGVILGGYLVYKASGNQAPLFRVRSDSPQGGTNIDDGFEEEEQQDIHMPDEAARANERFMSMFDPGEMIFGNQKKEESENGEGAKA